MTVWFPRVVRVFKRILVGMVILVFLAGEGFLVYAWHPVIEAIDPPLAASFPAELVERGRVLFGAGNCAACHAVESGGDYAGGRAIRTDFGTVYSTNITPDADTGIGRWSERAFRRAMREGLRRDGAHLFPAFPYDHFTRLTDTDIRALYAYLMSRPPVKAMPPDNTLRFPLNVRLLQAGWKLLFFDQGAFEPQPDKGEAWNRGAYLAEGLAHCGACHSPRNALGAESSGKERYAGAVVDGWYAPALTQVNASPLPWTQSELFDFLRSGATGLHGVAGGPMSEVVHRGLAGLPDADVQALAVYFAEVANAPGRISDDEIMAAMTVQSAPARSAEDEEGARLYASACAACHYNRPGAPLAARPEMALNSAVTGPDPANFIRLVVQGVGTTDGLPGAYMHGYGRALKDREIGVIAAYLRRAYAASEAGTEQDAEVWWDLEGQVLAARQREEGLE
jgi:mono/diheme cytochrome c family protein